jgi:hemolysin III
MRGEFTRGLVGNGRAAGGGDCVGSMLQCWRVRAGRKGIGAGILKLLKRYLMEPMSAVTHLVAAGAAVVGTLVLVLLSRGDGPKMISMLVYGASVIFLFVASTLYHGVKRPEADRLWLNRLDHAAIFVMIAGTYTPVVYNLFPSDARWPVLAAVWLVALAGAAVKLSSRRIHGFLNVSIYLFLSWGGAGAVAVQPEWLFAVPAAGLALLLLGGLIYSAGFITYYWEWPDPWPKTFGHHEVWHLFVIGGSLSHFLFMLWYVAPVARP